MCCVWKKSVILSFEIVKDNGTVEQRQNLVDTMEGTILFVTMRVVCFVDYSVVLKPLWWLIASWWHTTTLQVYCGSGCFLFVVLSLLPYRWNIGFVDLITPVVHINLTYKKTSFIEIGPFSYDSKKFHVLTR